MAPTGSRRSLEGCTTSGGPVSLTGTLDYSTYPNSDGGERKCVMSVLTRNLRPRDWVPFESYAPRVRYLDWIESLAGVAVGTQLTRTVLAEIARSRPRLTLLPALDELMINAEHMDYITLFLHPTLKKLEIKFSSLYRKSRTIEDINDIFLHIPAMAPGLQEFSVICSQPVSRFKDSLCTVLRSLPSLRKLILPQYWTADWVLDTLGSLPSLEAFDWSCYNGEGTVQDVFPFSPSNTLGRTEGFPALSHMCLEIDFPLARSFLSQSRLLERISSIDICTINRATPMEIYQFLQMCAESVVSSLKKLRLDGSPNALTSVVVEDILDMPILLPLLSCKQFTSFELVYTIPLNLSAVDLRRIGMELPNLRRLLLGEAPFHLSPPVISLSKVLPILVNYYPHLDEFGIYFDGNASFIDPTKLPTPHPTLRRLRVGPSPLSEENIEKVAICLSRVFTMHSNSDIPVKITSSLDCNTEYEESLAEQDLAERQQVVSRWEVAKRSCLCWLWSEMKSER
ncbi:hypothetical protein M422DRAFT_250267 [Sphaerobolus stellatus SS14]|uniref:Unplaced genomic scaffold SPHSTscaffold_33, whole genome shotgun sequence n=1 Tax=Sphaerobolus stellatus (strain SS14) TaxID=990650 RepID=A0A0C9VU82_SPHS4|nr:hypothetical protein M422DRAFT_250267 [Sphaerobolus stellatus SS14]